MLAEDYDPLVRVEEAASHALTVAKDRVTELSAQAKLAVSASIPVVQTSVASFFSFVKSVVTIDEDEYIEPEACGLTFVTRQLVGLSLSCCSSFFFAGLFSFMVSPCSVMRFPSSAPTSAAAAGALALISSFLRKHYAGRFMIFNLSEKAYDYSLFDNQVIELKFPGKEEEEEVEFEPMFRSLPGSERKFAASSYGLAHSRLSNSSTWSVLYSLRCHRWVAPCRPTTNEYCSSSLLGLCLSQALCSAWLPSDSLISFYSRASLVIQLLCFLHFILVYFFRHRISSSAVSFFLRFCRFCASIALLLLCGLPSCPCRWFCLFTFASLSSFSVLILASLALVERCRSSVVTSHGRAPFHALKMLSAISSSCTFHSRLFPLHLLLFQRSDDICRILVPFSLLRRRLSARFALKRSWFVLPQRTSVLAFSDALSSGTWMPSHSALLSLVGLISSWYFSCWSLPSLPVGVHSEFWLWVGRLFSPICRSFMKPSSSSVRHGNSPSRTPSDSSLDRWMAGKKEGTERRTAYAIYIQCFNSLPSSFVFLLTSFDRSLRPVFSPHCLSFLSSFLSGHLLLDWQLHFFSTCCFSFHFSPFSLLFVSFIVYALWSLHRAYTSKDSGFMFLINIFVDGDILVRVRHCSKDLNSRVTMFRFVRSHFSVLLPFCASAFCCLLHSVSSF